MPSKVTVGDLRMHPTPGALLYCRICGAENSAHADDYFMARSEHVFKCCGRNMLLVTKRTTYQEVNTQPSEVA